VVRIDRAQLVAAAAARALNDELTVIMSSLEGILDYLDDGHPALPLLAELQQSVQRCIYKSYELLEFGSRRGAQTNRTPLEKLLAS
jgi:glucan phosphorylase